MSSGSAFIRRLGAAPPRRVGSRIRALPRIDRWNTIGSQSQAPGVCECLADSSVGLATEEECHAHS
jgi:hypothetical protein